MRMVGKWFIKWVYWMFLVERVRRVIEKLIVEEQGAFGSGRVCRSNFNVNANEW